MSKAWIERWQVGRTGWHEPQGNASLQRHWTFSGRRVLVPLCGKSVDLLWLEEAGNEVVGVELSPLAVEAFFEENRIACSRSGRELVRYTARHRNISIVCGDYFALSGRQFDAHYDRGAMIAMDPGRRAEYAAHTDSLLLDGAARLVITVEYDQRRAAGPPYSIDATQVQSLWSGLEQVESREDIENAPPKFIEAGLKSMREVTWRTR